MSTDRRLNRQDRIRALIDDRVKRRAAGESISDESLIVAHPDLMPELGEQLKKWRVIDAAREQANPSNGDNANTVEHPPSKKYSRGLQICCPHCSNFMEVVTDTPYEEICCSTCGSSFSLVDRDEVTRMAAPLKAIGRFDLVSRVGIGGFGTVWKARDRELDRTVALKIPRRGQLAPAEIDQFFREARAAAQLQHPNIVPVHEVGRDGETIFIVSELVRGITLTDSRTGSPKSPKEIARLCSSIASALDHAHQHGVIHRDLKPSNIMIDESGQPHLTDFGLAKREVGEITMTVDGQVLGTPAYMSPEQAAGQAHWTDRRTDIYSLGVVLFELITGELPFRGNAQVQVHQRLTEDAPDPRKLNSHIPRDLATICCKCLEREPGRRYQTAGELRGDLQHFLEGTPITARAITPLERAIRWASRKPLQAALAALVVFLAVGGPAIALVLQRQRVQLQNKYNENANLIKKMIEDSKSDNSRYAKLEEKFKILDGQATPSEVWPPDPARPPKRQQLASILGAREAMLESAEASETEVERARRLFTVAVLADGVQQTNKARDYYLAASKVLAKLVSERSGDVPLSLTLADCYDRLSNLAAAKDRSESLQWLDKSLQLRRTMAEDNQSDAKLQALRLDVEMRSLAAAGSEKLKGGGQLAAVQELDIRLSNLWPQSPSELYRLVCLLSGQAPWLIDSAREESPATAVHP